eukprot:scaffold93338_cov57-Phaeocystis_antarctica.AAC.6
MHTGRRGALFAFIGAPAVRPNLLAVRRVLDVVREAAGLKVAHVHARLHREGLDSTCMVKGGGIGGFGGG